MTHFKKPVVAPKRKVKPLGPQARKVLNYLVNIGSASPRMAFNDIQINSGAFTSRIREIRDHGYEITDQWKKHPVTGQRYKEYTFGAHA